MSGVIMILTIIAAIISTVLELVFQTHWLIIVINDLIYLVMILLLAELHTNTKKIKHLEELLIEKHVVEEQDFVEPDVVEQAEIAEKNAVDSTGSSTNIRFCPKCKYQLFPEDTICPNCQTSIEEIDSK